MQNGLESYWESGSRSPGLHAFLIGVSSYPFAGGGAHEVPDTYGIGQLTSPATTVAQIAIWLRQNSASLAFPLKTLSVLASPSPHEAAHGTFSKIAPATLANVKAAAMRWQASASNALDGSEQDATLFYFAGHGIQRSRGDSILLLEDFLDPAEPTELARTIDVNNIYNGMANFTRKPALAKTQFYFIDACRSDVPGLRKFERQEPAALFSIDAGGVDDRIAPLFFASVAGSQTYGARGGLTLFGRDLLKCLNGSAGDKLSLPNGMQGWFVTIGSLADAMGKIVNAFNEPLPLKVRSLSFDKFNPTALDLPIRRLHCVPKVHCTLKIHPVSALQCASIRFDPPGAASRSLTLTTSPYLCTRDAGIYAIGGSVDPAQKPPYIDPEQEFVLVKPPFFQYSLRFQ
jgi:hypothetical protein